MAIKIAKGEICAFIDDDAYSSEDWLQKAVKYFENPHIVAVVGPGITPPDDSFLEKIGDTLLNPIFAVEVFNTVFIEPEQKYL